MFLPKRVKLNNSSRKIFLNLMILSSSCMDSYNIMNWPDKITLPIYKLNTYSHNLLYKMKRNSTLMLILACLMWNHTIWILAMSSMTSQTQQWHFPGYHQRKKYSPLFWKSTTSRTP